MNPDGLKKLKLECPVCLMIPADEIYQCKRGHIVCRRCVQRLSACPQCHTSFGTGNLSRNLFMESCLDNLTFDCPYSIHGCPVKGTRHNIDSHQHRCNYGETVDVCKHLGYPECNFKLVPGNTAAALEHFQNRHLNIEFLEQDCTARITNIDLLLHDFCKMARDPMMKPATWCFLVSSPGVNIPEKSFLVVCKVCDKISSWMCLDLNINDMRRKESQGTMYEVALTAPHGHPSIKWNLPIYTGREAGPRLESPPFEVSVSYLLEVFQGFDDHPVDGPDLCINLRIDNNPPFRLYSYALDTFI